MGLVIVKGHRRAGKLVKSYSRHQPSNRGSFGNPVKKKIRKTFWKKDELGRFDGRVRVGGLGDMTGIIREDEAGRIIGRTKAGE